MLLFWTTSLQCVHLNDIRDRMILTIINENLPKSLAMGKTLYVAQSAVGKCDNAVASAISCIM